MHYFETNQTYSYKNEIHKRGQTKINGNFTRYKRLVKNRVTYDIHRGEKLKKEPVRS